MGEEGMNVIGLLPKIHSLFLNKMFSDVEFLFEGDTEETSKVYGHRLILALRSDYFASMFYGNKEPPKQIKVKVPLKKKASYCSLLRFLYTDMVQLQSVEQAEDLLLLARQFGVNELQSRCLNYLVEESVTMDNIFNKYEFAIRRDIEPLLKNCRAFTCQHAESVFRSVHFDDASTEVVEDILKQENLSVLSEIVVLNSVLSWGRSKCLKNNIPVDDNSLKKYIYPFMKHIRFLTLTAGEFQSILKDYNIFNAYDSFLLTSKIFNPQSDVIIPEYICNLRIKRGAFVLDGAPIAYSEYRNVSECSNILSNRNISPINEMKQAYAYRQNAPTGSAKSDDIWQYDNRGVILNKSLSPHSSHGSTMANQLQSSDIYNLVKNDNVPNKSKMTHQTVIQPVKDTTKYFKHLLDNLDISNASTNLNDNRRDISNSDEQNRTAQGKSETKQTYLSHQTASYKPDDTQQFGYPSVALNRSFSNDSRMANELHSSDLYHSVKKDVPSRSKSTHLFDLKHEKELEEMMQSVHMVPKETQNSNKQKVTVQTTPPTIASSNSATSDLTRMIESQRLGLDNKKSHDSSNKISYEVREPRLFDNHNSLSSQRNAERFKSVPNLSSQPFHVSGSLPPRFFEFPLSESVLSMDSSFRRDIRCSVSFLMKSGSIRLCGFELFIKNLPEKKREMIEVDVDLTGFSETIGGKPYKGELKSNVLEIRFPAPLSLNQKKGELQVSIDSLVSHRCRVSSSPKCELNNGPNCVCELSLQSNQKVQNGTLFLINRLLYIPS